MVKKEENFTKFGFATYGGGAIRPSFEKYQVLPTGKSVVPVVQSDLQRMTFQGELNPERFGSYDNWERYRDGGHSIIYLATDSETGRKVAIKEHLHYMPDRADEAQAIRDARTRYEREMTILSRLDHPGIVGTNGFFFRKKHGIPTPYLVMEFLEQDSVAEKLQKGEKFDEKKARELALSVGTIFDYLHVANGRPIVYRDFKPGNVKPMPNEAVWPHKLLDFSESRIGNATMSGSVLGTPGYNAPETNLGIADRTVDFYSLMKVASHMLIGDNNKFVETYLGHTSLNEMNEQGDLNVSEQFLKAIERATARDPSHRYKTLAELAKDLGYNISRVPETRQELEAILEHKSLPARIEPRTQVPAPVPAETERGEVANVNTSSNLPEVIDDKAFSPILLTPIHGGDLRLITYKRGGNGALPPEVKSNITFKPGNSPYETAQNLRGTYREVTGRGPSYYEQEKKKGHIDPHFHYPEDDIDSLTLAYFQTISRQEHPILQPVAEGTATLEGMLREKKQYNPFLTRRTRAADLEAGEIQNDWEVNIFSPTEESIKRRKQLLNVFGMKEEDFKFIGDGSIIGAGIGCVGGYLIIGGTAIGLGFGSFSTLMGFLSTPLGAIASSNIVRSYFNHKLTSKAREMDSWIAQARNSGKSLEERAKEVELTGEEKRKSLPVITPFITAMGAYGVIEHFFDFIPGKTDGIPGWIAIAAMAGTMFGLKKYRENRALKKKRQALGLPEDGMTCSETIQIRDESHRRLRDTLSHVGLKKKLLRKRFIGQDVRVSYQDCYFKEGIDASLYHNTDVTIRAASREKLEQIQKALKPLELSAEQTEKPEITSRGMDHGWGGFGT